jgi:predicted oxidoreductase
MAWAPLGGGIISDETHPRYRAIRACTSELAAKYQTGENQILLAWLLRHPAGILPVVGTTKLERLLEAKEAQNIQLEREDWFRLLEAAVGEEVA